MSDPITPPEPLDADPGAATGDDTPPAGTTDADVDIDTDADPDGADDLGDKGKKALVTMKAQWRAEQKRARDAEAKLAARDAPKDGDELTPDQIRKQARDEALAELRAPLFQAQAKSAALALGFNDPSDALLLMNAADFEVASDGTFDAEELNDRLSDVLAAKPYLAKNNPAGQPGEPTPRTVGAAKAGGSPKSPTIDERIAKARADGDVDLQISLQTMKLAPASR